MTSFPANQAHSSRSAPRQVFVHFRSHEGELSEMCALRSEFDGSEVRREGKALECEKILAALLLQFFASGEAHRSIQNDPLHAAVRRPERGWLCRFLGFPDSWAPQECTAAGRGLILAMEDKGRLVVKLTEKWHGLRVSVWCDGQEAPGVDLLAVSRYLLDVRGSEDPFKQEVPTKAPTEAELTAAYAGILKRLQEVAAGRSLSPFAASWFSAAVPGNQPSCCNWGKLIAEKGANAVLLEVQKWLSSLRPTDRAVLTDLREFCAGVALTAVHPVWTAKVRTDVARAGLRIPRDRDVVTMRDGKRNKANIGYWILTAVIWEQGHRQPFSLEGLLGVGDGTRGEIHIPEAIAARGPTEAEQDPDLLQIVVNIANPGHPASLLANPDELQVLFEVAKENMKGGYEEGAPFRIIYDEVKDAGPFLERVRRAGLSEPGIAYLLCRARKLREVLPAAERIATRLHAIHDLTKL